MPFRLLGQLCRPRRAPFALPKRLKRNLPFAVIIILALVIWAYNFPSKPTTDVGVKIVEKKLPRIQFEFGEESAEVAKTRKKRQGQVKDAFLHAWKGYKEHAWLHDEVMPISGGNKGKFSFSITGSWQSWH